MQSQITITGNTLSKISFCDKQCSNINDNKVKGQLINYLETKYGIHAVARDYNIINPNTLRIVSFHQHILTPYSNGNPYLLYLTKIDNINCCIYIDKKLKDGYTYPKMHCVKYRFNDDIFVNDTILSGELVKDNERRWIFLIDNILLYKGQNMTEKNIISKFEIIYNMMATEYKYDKYLEICPLQVKKLFLYKDVRKMVNDFIPNLSYTCKGIVFYTLNNKCSNFAFLMPRDAQFQIKSPDEINDIIQQAYPKLWQTKHSIPNEIIPEQPQHQPPNISIPTANDDIIDNEHVVFKVLKTDMPDIYNLYCLDENNTLIKHSIALVPNIKISHYLYNTFKTNPNLSMNIECKYSKIFEKWTPIKFVNHPPYTNIQVENIQNKFITEQTTH